MLVERPTQIAGVDGCKAGWIAVTAIPKAFEKAEVKIFASFAELISQLAARSIIAIDMPIGVPERTKKGGREPDWAAREFLGSQRASVFPVPSRQAVYAYAKGFTEVCATSASNVGPASSAFETTLRTPSAHSANRRDPATRAGASRAGFRGSSRGFVQSDEQ